MDRSGCASATGKTGASTGRAVIATSCASLAISCWAKNSRSTGTDAVAASAVKAIWLEPPADMGRPVWRDVLEQIQLGPNERAAILASVTNERPSHARALGQNRRQRSSPASLARQQDALPFTLPISPSCLTRTASPGSSRLRIPKCPPPPSPSPTAKASPSPSPHADPAARVGIAVQMIAARPHCSKTHPSRRSNGKSSPARLPRSTPEWITRFWCAREAAARRRPGRVGRPVSDHSHQRVIGRDTPESRSASRSAT